MNTIRKIVGAIIVIVGAFIFQIGFVIMPKDMQEIFAEKFAKTLFESISE